MLAKISKNLEQVLKISKISSWSIIKPVCSNDKIQWLFLNPLF